ncbi:hypothetical protein Bca52824_036975 [Brassica carinata]|uniref:Alpha/beta hydrolase fold-3 domain-containing protein n=1 Tax=Brassica carinata TaxID=52824 RepID=A0A8X7S3V0_BRACI|nr:hypothetical protein Bca52824_036975 [Brassica carinata]
MPSVAVKLYSVFFKLLLKHRLQNLISASPDASPDPFGVSTRPDESVAAANPSFSDGVATKDIHVDPMTSLAVRIFLPESALSPSERDDSRSHHHHRQPRSDRRHSHVTPLNQTSPERSESRRRSYGCTSEESYGGYAPSPGRSSRKLPVMLQFHGGGWVAGGCDSAANDFFCRRIAKVCDVIVLAVGYRLAPENRYPAAFEDGVKVLNWLGKQANLADCCKSLGNNRLVHGVELKKLNVQGHVVDALELLWLSLGLQLMLILPETHFSFEKAQAHGNKNVTNINQTFIHNTCLVLTRRSYSSTRLTSSVVLFLVHSSPSSVSARVEIPISMSINVFKTSVPDLPLFFTNHSGLLIVLPQWKPQIRPEASCLISIFHGTPAVFLASRAVFSISSGFSFSSANTAAQNTVLDFSVAYFLTDLLYIVFYLATSSSSAKPLSSSSSPAASSSPTEPAPS